ncbi:MAG TPA: SIS domain-containing protein [Abditibacterium sp.]|jgi:D-sedoheptulose 7-phosphate isomerase
MNPYFSHFAARFPDCEPLLAPLDAAFETLKTCFESGGKLLLCGNGGSAADCEHIAAELVNKFERLRPISSSDAEKLHQMWGKDGDFLARNLQGALPALSLVSQTALMTALANDVAAEWVFAQQVWAYGAPNDVLLGISTSGNSGNVLHALRVAKFRGLKTIGLSGRDGGAMRELCDVCLIAPRQITAEIQEMHLPLYHALCGALEEHFFGEPGD